MLDLILKLLFFIAWVKNRKQDTRDDYMEMYQ